MSKLKLSTREIGTVHVFDLEGQPTQETLQDAAWKIQRQIRRHRWQRIIINLQHMPILDALEVRKLLAACLRPQASLIYGASQIVTEFLESTYLPRNVHLCPTEKEVAEDFGPFLLEKERDKEIMRKVDDPTKESIGKELERRRSKRMHVVIPVDITLFPAESDPVTVRTLATNISEGGLFAEFLDLDAADKIQKVAGLKGMKAEIHIYPSANFPEEYHLDGVVCRTELRKKQLGIAIEFVE
jgi:hypothetical protein